MLLSILFINCPVSIHSFFQSVFARIDLWSAKRKKSWEIGSRKFVFSCRICLIPHCLAENCWVEKGKGGEGSDMTTSIHIQSKVNRQKNEGWKMLKPQISAMSSLPAGEKKGQKPCWCSQSFVTRKIYRFPMTFAFFPLFMILLQASTTHLRPSLGCRERRRFAIVLWAVKSHIRALRLWFKLIWLLRTRARLPPGLFSRARLGSCLLS